MDQAGVQEDKSTAGASPAHLAWCSVAVAVELQHVGLGVKLPGTPIPLLHDCLI